MRLFISLSLSLSLDAFPKDYRRFARIRWRASSLFFVGFRGRGLIFYISSSYVSSFRFRRVAYRISPWSIKYHLQKRYFA